MYGTNFYLLKPCLQVFVMTAFYTKYAIHCPHQRQRYNKVIIELCQIRDFAAALGLASFQILVSHFYRVSIKSPSHQLQVVCPLAPSNKLESVIGVVGQTSIATRPFLDVSRLCFIFLCVLFLDCTDGRRRTATAEFEQEFMAGSIRSVESSQTAALFFRYSLSISHRGC